MKRLWKSGLCLARLTRDVLSQSHDGLVGCRLCFRVAGSLTLLVPGHITVALAA